MSHIISAVYEHGVLHPLTALKLQEHQRILMQILPEYPQETVEHVLEWLIRIGRLSPPQPAEDIAPCSENERIQLAQTLGEATTVTLSTFILEERGEW